MTKHQEASPYAGTTVRPGRPLAGITTESPDYHYRVEDWFDRVLGESWMTAKGHPAALHYAMRSAIHQLPFDDEVLYGEIGARAYLVHISEIEGADG